LTGATGRRTVLVAAGILASLGGVPARADAQDALILPPAAHATGQARALAEAHAGELRALAGAVARCAPAVTIERRGIAFQRPQQAPAATPHLTLWVWLPAEPLPGGDPAARAGEAFRRYGRLLVRRLVARSAILTDDRVGGYGLILSWLGPGSQSGRPIAESLVMFTDKVTAANFALDTIAAPTFLERAELRLFEGRSELAGARPTMGDEEPPVRGSC
jgi:hypothetical protein